MSVSIKKISKYFIIVLMAMLVVIAVAAMGLRLYFNDEHLRIVLTDTAGEYLNANFKLGKIGISLFSSINIDSLYIISEPDTIIGCERLGINYSLRRLLSGELEITGVSLRNPMINLRTSPEGALDLSWLKIIGDTTKSEESQIEEASSDTTTTLPVTIKLAELKIIGARISIAGGQQIRVDGLNFYANDMKIIATDSISGNLRLSSGEDAGLRASYAYSDSLGTLSAYGNLKMEINSQISAGNRISGEIKMAADSLHTDIYGHSKTFNCGYSSDFEYDIPTSRLSVNGIEATLNDKELLKADFKMKFAESDTIYPMALTIREANLDFTEIRDLVKSNMPGIEFEGKFSASDITVIMNEEYSGIKFGGNAAIVDFYLKMPEYGIDIRNLNLEANTSGILMGADAGYVLELDGFSDSIFYAIDETTTIAIPSSTLSFAGSLDSLFLPDSLSGEISINGLFGDTLVVKMALAGGIPPMGTISMQVDAPRLRLNQFPYMEYAGLVSVEINGRSRGERFDFNGRAAITELFLKLEEDSLLIPELPFDISGQVKFDETYARYFIQQYTIKSPSLFEISGTGKFNLASSTELNADFEGVIWHKYLEDFIPIGLRDSLGRMKLTGESRVKGRFSMVIDANGNVTDTMIGVANSKIDTLAVELYAFNAEDMSLDTKFDLIDNHLKGRSDFSIKKFAFDDTLMLPLTDIGGQTSLAYRDSTFSWENASIEIKSHHLKVTSRGSYLVSDQPTMTMSAGIEFQSRDTVAVMGNLGITGRFEATIELAMNDTLLSLRGSVTPLLLSAISPGLFSIESITGSIPFDQSIIMPQMRLVGRDATDDLNLLDYEVAKYYLRGKNEGRLSFERLEAGRVYIENFDLTIEVGNGRIIGRRLFSDVYGGNMLGDFYLDLRSIDFGAIEINPDSLRYAVNLQLSGVNFDRLAGSKTISQSADICGDLSLVGRGIVDPQADFELEGQMNITKIGSRATIKLLDFLDPTGTDISIAETRKLIDRRLLFLDMSYQPKRFSMKIKHGNINPTIDMDQPFYAKYLRIGAVTMPVEYDRKQLQAMLKAAAATPIEE